MLVLLNIYFYYFIMAIFGYARVSTIQQELFAQIEQLKKIDSSIIIFQEQISTSKEQIQLKLLLNELKEHDILYVTELSRLARSFSGFVQIGKLLQEKNINFICIKENINNQNVTGKFMLNLFASLYELEKDWVRERTIKTLESKRKRGIFGGRPKIPKSLVTKVLADYDRGMTLKELLSCYHISKTSLYKYIKQRNILNDH